MGRRHRTPSLLDCRIGSTWHLAQHAVHPKVTPDTYRHHDAYGPVAVFSDAGKHMCARRAAIERASREQRKEEKNRHRVARPRVSNDDVCTVCKNSWTYAAVTITRLQYCTVASVTYQRGDDPSTLSTRPTARIRISPQPQQQMTFGNRDGCVPGG